MATNMNTTNNKSHMEMITTVDEYGCVVSVEFIQRGTDGDKVIIIRTKEMKEGDS